MGLQIKSQAIHLWIYKIHQKKIKIQDLRDNKAVIIGKRISREQ
jgi:hypothetical protein